jgi:hypothetical protein
LGLVVRVELTIFKLDDKFLRVLEKANFVVKAKMFTLTVTDHNDLAHRSAPRR